MRLSRQKLQWCTFSLYWSSNIIIIILLKMVIKMMNISQSLYFNICLPIAITYQIPFFLSKIILMCLNEWYSNTTFKKKKYILRSWFIMVKSLLFLYVCFLSFTHSSPSSLSSLWVIDPYIKKIFFSNCSVQLSYKPNITTHQTLHPLNPPPTQTAGRNGRKWVKF